MLWLELIHYISAGEGIHHAMEGGKLAAKFLDRVMNHGNYSREVMKIYHDEWMDQFGSDFKWCVAEEIF